MNGWRTGTTSWISRCIQWSARKRQPPESAHDCRSLVIIDPTARLVVQGGRDERRPPANAPVSPGRGRAGDHCDDGPIAGRPAILPATFRRPHLTAETSLLHRGSTQQCDQAVRQGAAPAHRLMRASDFQIRDRIAFPEQHVTHVPVYNDHGRTVFRSGPILQDTHVQIKSQV
jgi:hypothetical protein